MKNFSKPLLIVFFVFCAALSYSQDIHVRSRSESIEIKKDSSFVNQITVTFASSDKLRLYPIIYDTELEKVSDIQLFARKGKRLKKLELKKVYEEKVELDYISSKKIKSVPIPADTEVELVYSLSCKELMYFSGLNFFSYNQIDTLTYQIKVPEEFKLVHNTIYKDSLSFYKMDSVKTKTAAIWNIKVVPKKVAPDPLQLFGIYKNLKVPLMRTLVVTKPYKNQSANYINDWYLEQISSKKGLNEAALKKIDELTHNIAEPREVLNVIYNYVRSNFKYVAIEIGMGAFIPSHVNEVYESKQGDCKDLSNFLTEALKYKGIKSDIALAATFDHISDCDFPSLSSANHVISVAYINNETILLDPTDPVHEVGTPVQSLQDRTILIVNSKGGSFYKVDAFNPEQNEIFYQLELKIDTANSDINGEFTIDYKGISGNFLRRIRNSDGETEFDNYAKTFFKELFGNQVISDLEVTPEPEKLAIKGTISVLGKTFSDNSNTYLFIDFLPRLIETESRETLLEGTHLGNPFYKKVRAKIKLDKPVAAFKTIEHNYKEEGISLNMSLRALSNTEIECNYDFSIDYIFIDKDNSSKINEILKSFKKISNEPIILNKQNN